MNLQYVPLLALATALAIYNSQRVDAAVKLPTMFGNGMVLQRDQAVPIWGKASAHESVQVELAAQKKNTIADANGNWQITLAPMTAAKNQVMTVRATNTISVKDVQIGDVWICSGQSNMEFPLGASDYNSDAISNLQSAQIRMYESPGTACASEQSDPHGRWEKPTADLVKTFPAIPYLFGRSVALDRNIPVGIISAASSGAPIESFLPEETIKRTKCEGALMVPPHKLSGNFKTRLYPFLHFAVKGIVWYQGESNIFNAASYKEIFPAFIQDLRKRMNSPMLPFVFVQLPNFGFRQPDNKPADSFWADMREAQSRACSLAQVFMVVAIDTAGDDASSLHPKEKSVIAQRLAQVAERIMDNKIKSAGAPLAVSQEIENDSLIVTLKNLSAPLSTPEGGRPQGFQLAAADHRFYWADAEIHGNTIKVTSDDVNDPVAVRYAWADNPLCNVYSGETPLAPFRTDNWKTNPKLNPAAAQHVVSK